MWVKWFTHKLQIKPPFVYLLCFICLFQVCLVWILPRVQCSSTGLQALVLASSVLTSQENIPPRPLFHFCFFKSKNIPQFFYPKRTVSTQASHNQLYFFEKQSECVNKWENNRKKSTQKASLRWLSEKCYFKFHSAISQTLPGSCCWLSCPRVICKSTLVISGAAPSPPMHALSKSHMLWSNGRLRLVISSCLKIHPLLRICQKKCRTWKMESLEVFYNHVATINAYS